ncbi:MAG TPA: hypothetical protein VFP43_22515 [Mesorhizobium sp.]|nr:hypothetical protein [Mesorhizobium sp.]
MPNPKDPLIVIALERRAQANAGNNHTGIASHGNISVRYYPACNKFDWFGEYGRITKRHAIELLTAAIKWKTPA